MEETSTLSIFLAVVAAFISIYCITRLIFARKHPGHAEKRAPEAGGSWPILGHLPLLGGTKPSHLVLANMADKYGPIFTIRLGIHRTVVVSNPEVAKEFLTTHDRNFATRPTSVASDVLTYNYAMIGLAPYGPFWRQVRKISTLELLSHNRLELLRHVRESEVFASVQGVYEQYNKLKFADDYAARAPSRSVHVDMKRWFGDINVNIVFRMIVGRRYDDGDEKARQALRDFFDHMGRFIVSDGLPYLRWLDIGGHEKAMKRTIEELDRAVQGWLDEHKAKRRLNEEAGGPKRVDEDFMDVMLSILEGDNEFQSYDADTINKATCLSFILAASDTTTVSLTWALSLLLNNREALKKAQQELDGHVGKNRRVTESDLKDLPYLQAVIKETLRLYPAGPLAIPHEAVEDCTVAGYFIPKGTGLVINIYKIHHDPRFWTDPYKFHPERFLNDHKDVDVRGQNFEFIPFGRGRRMCPGISMAQQVLGLSLGSFLHAFEVVGDEPVDMEEASGLTNLKASPLEVSIAPRLPEHIYHQ